MAVQLPDKFTAIKNCNGPSPNVSIIGVIVSCFEPKRSAAGAGDWSLGFTVQDDFTSGSVGGHSSMNCRLFRPELSMFPKITGPGDVVVLRKFKLSAWNQRLDCVNVKRVSEMLVFPGSGIPGPDMSQAYEPGGQKTLPYDSITGTSGPSKAEQMAVIHMKHASSGSEPQLQQHAAITAAKATTSKRQSSIKDLELNRFYDLRVQVVNKYYHNMDHDKVELKVTDYTPNKDVLYYADPEKEDWLVTNRNWKGPFGYLTMSVTLFDEHAAWAQQHVEEGDFVYIRNVHVKMSPANKLEGVLHRDKLNPNQVDIRQMKNSADIEDINKRREAYEKQRGSKTVFPTLQDVPDKSSAKTSSDKKKAKRERQRAEKEVEQQELQKKAHEWETSRGGVNTNIRAAYPEIKLSTVSEIIYNHHLDIRTPVKQNPYTLPFVNCKHRSRIRVVDVFPSELELFAHSTSDPNWATQSRKQSSTERWEWGFVLLVEDADIPRNTVSEKLRVVVNNAAAQHLLNMDALDLKNNARKVRQLEEKLFILWGNLMELKTELRDKGLDLPLPAGDNRLQNKPFDACIEEYGCQVPITEQNPFGYQRMHKLAQTKIELEQP